MKNTCNTLGQALQKRLSELNLNAYELADILKLTPSHIYYILRGNRSFSPLCALMFSKTLGGTPEYWLALKHDDDLKVARETYAAELRNLKLIKKRKL